MSEYTTKDSGSRAEFANGGVRDSQAGKARFDLVCPVNVPYQAQMLTRWAELMGRGAEKYADRNWEQFSDQAALDRAKSSAFRHFMQWFTGAEDTVPHEHSDGCEPECVIELDDVTEDHAAAVFFNVMAAEYVDGVLKGQWQATGQLDVVERYYAARAVRDNYGLVWVIRDRQGVTPDTWCIDALTADQVLKQMNEAADS
ncbi:dATP/dGTP diphosphohydrolase domain-containing protein [Lentzea sp. NBRC 102530]|uniref:dATP/dGTP diphosphohydrolase domain-containing protein n=1 Tax=Lentzea sp. NBRC 102530 TaxID=3032201 RepID=UPI0024A236B4|nr:dATP/dGTP diphosphohydrolase domain-containing protein [Lentzea sp. NBRC 102530]GLY55348.1 hypothetical protein Lesp01_90030 [Lentzea sp. NBRC 102530]